jgi:hypothetical protein
MDEYFLYFELPDGSKDVRYDLKTLNMQKFQDRCWCDREQCYDYFRGFNINHLQSDNTKFLGMLRKAKELNPNCTSLSTFIARLSDALVGEQYEQEGIDYECYANRSYYNRVHKNIIKRPLSFYDKHLINLFKKTKFKVSCNFEMHYEGYKEMVNSIINTISTMDFDNEQILDVLHLIESRPDDFGTLIVEYKYDVKALLNYVFKYLEPFENLELRESLHLLTDYYRMGHQIGRKLKKYPKYLKSMHDIILSNYNAYKREYDEKRFASLVRNDLIHEDKKFVVLVPKTTKDIIEEGTNLNHCVSSYVDRIIRGDTYIAFMRLKELQDTSLLTLEIKDNKLINAKGAYNRPIVEEEKKFLEMFCRQKNLAIDV